MSNLTNKAPEWLYVFIFCIAGISVVSQGFIMIPIENQLIFHLQIPKDTAYLSSSAFSIFYAIGFLIFAPLSNRFGKKNILVLGLFALSFCTLTISFCKIYNLFLFLRALQGLVAATFTPLALAYAFELFIPKRQGYVIGILSTAFTMSSILGQILSNWFISQYTFPTLFYFFAFIHLLCGAILYFILPTSIKSNRPLSITYWLDMFKLFQNRYLAICLAITFTQFLSFVAIYSSLHHLLTQMYHLTNHEILLFQCLGLIGMSVSPFMNNFITHTKAPKIITLGLIITCTGVLLFLKWDRLYFLSVTTIIFAAGISIVLPSIIFHIGQISGKKKGVAMALYTFTLFLGSSIGPYIGTKVIFKYVVLIIFSVLFLTILISLSLRKKQGYSYENIQVNQND
ncbi:MFS transporter [Bacillus sp. BP-3]|uniref:MFS transporter n=1 Tax=Bacillus sp. BP-3 TaxID=3022773 RepID=UPI00232CE380|nr:MFS transporter [Bacillus sp. BP-3]MDC2865854.1 MFS transporter [Bacillus sp. BP-3]